MASFSERIGFKPVRTILQKDGIDPALRNRLWNRTYAVLTETCEQGYLRNSPVLQGVAREIRHVYFKERIDNLPNFCDEVITEIRTYFMACRWNEVYDFLEFFARIIPASWQFSFRASCNVELAAELSAYRFVGGRIAPLTTEEEIAAIEEAASITGPLDPAGIHLRRALDLMADREKPDYRNSIKESISAVEAVCKLLSCQEKAELGDALRELDKKLQLHGALKQAFLSLYGYTSDAEGIRHALLEEPDLTQDDAKFMLVACAAFVNYLVALAAKAGINL